MRLLTLALATTTVVTSAATALAQMPAEIIPQVAAIGRVVDPPKTAAIYGPLQEQEPYKDMKVARDVAYGPDARHRADIFQLEAVPAGARPVLVFVHGGGFVAGTKHAPNSPFYDNVLLWAARNGMVGVNLEYRLAPAASYPGAAQDMATAMAWVSENISAYGGDPKRIFLMGHSAGAVHVATYVAHNELHGRTGPLISGAIFSSGIYSVTPENAGDGEKAFYGADPAKYAERSALAGLVKTETPFMFSYAELDPPVFWQQADLLREARCKGPQGCARSVFLPKHGHMSASYSINTKDSTLTNSIMEFVKMGR